jgi:FAD/FMN-containing dehydrogenase
MNPDVVDAFALAIIAGNGPSAFPPFSEPDLADARENATGIHAAMSALRKVALDAGNYMSECDYFAANWQKANWGQHWERLSRIKRRYDTDGLFVVHHGVGSDDWSSDGFTRLA